MGSVYIIRVDRSNFRKIGHAESDVQRRLATLQTGCPYDLILEYELKTELYREVERLMHLALAPYHRRGEWFEVALETVLERLKILEGFLENEAMSLIMLEAEDDVAPPDREPTPQGKRRCPHCQNLFSVNNIRRHVRFCEDIPE